MKKITAVLLSVMMLFAFAACGASDPKTTVVNAYNKTNALTHFDMSMNVLTETTSPIEMSIEMPMEMKMIQEGKTPVAMYLDMDLGGIEFETTYTDGVMYVSMMGIKQKQALSIEEFMSQSPTQPLPGEDIEKHIQDVQAVGKDEDGNDRYEVRLNDDYFKTVTDSMLGANFDSLGVDMSSMDMEFDTSSCFMSVDRNGYLSAMSIAVSAKTSVDGETTEMNIEVDTKYHNPGKTFEINPPADAEEYQEQ